MTALVDDDAPTTRIAVRHLPAGRHARPEFHGCPAVPSPYASAYLHPAEAPAGLGAAWARGGAPIAGPSTLGRRLAEAFGPNGLHEIPPPIRRHPRIALAALGGFILVAITLIATLAVPGTMTVRGSFTAHGSSPLTSGATCWSASYSAGTAVTVVDGTGATVALGALGEGQATTDTSSVYGQYGYATDCTFSFTVPDVPEGGSVYGISIGATRNAVVFSEAEMAAGPAIENGR